MAESEFLMGFLDMFTHVFSRPLILLRVCAGVNFCVDRQGPAATASNETWLYFTSSFLPADLFYVSLAVMRTITRKASSSPKHPISTNGNISFSKFASLTIPALPHVRYVFPSALDRFRIAHSYAPGRQVLPPRFLRHSPLLLVDSPAQESLKQIYGAFNSALLQLHPPLRGHLDGLTNAMIEFYLLNQVFAILSMLVVY